MRTNNHTSQTRHNANRLFELLSSGTSDIDKLLEALNISIDQLDDLFDSNPFTQRQALQTRLTLFQCRQIGLKLLPELVHRLHQLTESDKPETARRAINTFLNMAGMPTQPVRLPPPPKPDEPIEEDLQNLHRQYPDVYGIPFTEYVEDDDQSQDDPNHESGQAADHDEDQTRDDTDEESDQDDDQETPESAQSSALSPQSSTQFAPQSSALSPQHSVADRLLDLKRNHNLDLTRLAPADYPRLTDFLLSLHSPSPASPVTPHTNQNPIESTVSSTIAPPKDPPKTGWQRPSPYPLSPNP